MSGLAVLCPGQGRQHAAMLDLALTAPAGAAAVRDASAALGADVPALVRAEGTDLFRNAVAQPLLCAAELATWAALRERIPEPRLFAGYSLGELAAYGCAGALDMADTIALAVRRAELMDACVAVDREPTAAARDGGLVGVRGLRVDRAEQLAADTGAEIAIVNGPEHCIVGGAEGPLAAFADRALRAGAVKVERLAISVAAHTSALREAVAPFATALERSSLRDPRAPIVAGISAEPVRRRADAVATLSRQLAERIDWARCLAAAVEQGCTVFVELGPGAALAKMVKEVVPWAEARSVEEFRSLDGVARWVDRALALG